MPASSSKKTHSAINERLKILIDLLNMSARAFSAAIEMPDSNTRNYLSKGTKLNSDYLESIASHFSHVNLAWLLTGKGEPFLANKPVSATTQQISSKSKSSIGMSNGGTNTINHSNLEDYRRDLESANREIDHLRQQLQLQSALLASKEETIALLRANYNRPT